MNKFYNRCSELNELKKLNSTEGSSRMVVLTGRRRVGKTALALEFARNLKHVYLFVAKKAETMLCEEYLNEIKGRFPELPVIGEIHYFRDIFELLLRLSQKEKFTVVIDEFQEFYYINPSVYSDIQKLWDLNKNRCELTVVFIGSVYSLMYKIFQNSREPLFNRADRIMHLKPFTVGTIAEILADNKAPRKLLFDYYLFTGGSPKYIEILVDNRAFTFDKIIDVITSTDSPFINEGKNLLIEEFGKEYGVYFSILELISSGKTGRSEIESILETNIGGYLDRLEKDYGIIGRIRPINAKPNSRKMKYAILDNFLNFWFRFLYRNRSAVEIGNFEYIKNIIKRDYDTYAGKILEKFFKDILGESKKYNRIGSYWERDGGNEIDIVAVNDAEKKVLIGDVKLSAKKLDLVSLQRKAAGLVDYFKGYDIEYRGFSGDDAMV
ncbi:MAG TPA: ATP-binding protein [Spirochaetota bacterium]|nr:ATP-binding protein [Spirochaetota bacterium]